jgi:adenosylmethionine-8-amino-7-oxononanoate aminotransferase
MSSLKSNILHRTSWKPPVAESGQGIYITLEDGTRLIDGVGGAAVTCVGNGHPKVIQAIKDQMDKVSYVYNMQLSSQPAEALAKKIGEYQSRGLYVLWLCIWRVGGHGRRFEIGQTVCL